MRDLENARRAPWFRAIFGKSTLIFRALGSGGGAAGTQTGDGVRGGMGSAAQPRRFVPVVAGAGAGFVWIRGVGGGALRQYSDVARTAIGT